MLVRGSSGRLLSVHLWLKISTLLLCYVTSNAMEFLLELRMPRYVVYGQPARLRCEYGLPASQLRKVEWFRAGTKIFSYVKDRTPPFRNGTTLNGSQLDWSQSDDKQIMLRNLTFDASGFYSCQVSTQTPIYTKASNDEELTVIHTQRAPPEITELQPMYTVGDLLSVNCTSSPSRPSADVTWLVNDKPVPERSLKLYPGRIHGEHRIASTTVQLAMEVTEEHVNPVAGLELTCLATIPAYVGDEHEYADRRKHSTSVDVELPRIAESTSSPQPRHQSSSFHVACLALVAASAARCQRRLI